MTLESIPSFPMTNTYSLIQCVAFTVFIFRYTILHLYGECYALGRFFSRFCCSIWQAMYMPRQQPLETSNCKIILFFFQLSESRALLAGYPQKWSKSTQTPIIHFISSLKLCLLHMFNAAKDSHTWLIRQESKCAMWITLCLMVYLYFCARYRRQGGSDEGEPEALHHGAREGVWRVGYSLQLHQDCHCQEWVSTDTWKNIHKCSVLNAHTHTHTLSNLLPCCGGLGVFLPVRYQGYVDTERGITSPLYERSWWNTTHHRSVFSQHSS